MSCSATFTELLRDALEKSGLSQRDFAKKCRISGGFPPLLLSGKRTPPLDKIDIMGRTLGMSDDRLEEFRRAALLAHAPKDVAALVNKLESQLAQMRQQHSLILQELSRLGIQLPKGQKDV